ncbi:MAG: hypothetical protein PWP16_9 [Eubacteriaceae bacterium]|jgi:hypothetical protein|nr:hypothetical protein [Eubacteriaceae bacterium]MDK2935636.1 hypothetical protein [Eubacteriaceae bacterium]MDN5306646.1 hypothetical protein [Eubacteriaceae bacterium]
MPKQHQAGTCNCHDEHHHHDHAHHDHHHHLEQKKHSVKIHTHDSSVIGSFKIEMGESLSVTESKIEDCLKKIAEGVDSCGGIIGHIKGFVQYQGENSMLSITDEEVTKKRGLSNLCTCECVAIVFNVAPPELEKIITNELLKLLPVMKE